MSTATSKAVSALVLALLLASTVPALLPGTSGEDGDVVGPWDHVVRIDSGDGSARAMNSLRMAMGADGSTHVAWLEDRRDGTDAFAARLPAGQTEWKDDVKVNEGDNQPRITPTTCDVEVDDDGRVYATYVRYVGTQGGWRVRFTRSEDGGATFRSPSDAFPVVNTTLNQEHPALAINERGKLHIVYVERTPDTSRLIIVTSEDGLNPQAPSAVELGQPKSVHHVQGDVAIGPDGTIYVAYGYRAPGEAGIRVAKKPAVGGSFTNQTVYRIEEDSPRFLRPLIAVSGDGVVEVAFDPLDTGSRLLHIRSDDGGDTFADPSMIWAAGEPGDSQSNLDLAFDDLGRLHVVWAQGGDAPPKVFHAITADGSAFTQPTELNGDWNEDEDGPRGAEDFPVVVPLADGGVAVAFIANLNNTKGVYYTVMGNQPPEATIEQPAPGAVVKGDVVVQGTARDPRGTTGIAAVYVQVGDGTPVRRPGSTVWEWEFDSTAYPDGLLNISAWASDGFMVGPKVNITVDVDNNVPPVMNLARPENRTEHEGRVNVVGTANDEEGFAEGWTVQYRIGDGEWKDSGAGDLQTDRILDYDFFVDLRDRPSGDVTLHIRVSDGDKFSNVASRNVHMDNRPDLMTTLSMITFDVEEPEHTDVVAVTVEVTNQGVAYSGPYDVSFFHNVKDPVTVAGSNLSAGDSETLVFTWFVVGGKNQLKFVIDPLFLIDELDRDNNEVTITKMVPKPQEDGDDEGPNWVLIGIVIVVVVAGAGGALMLLKSRGGGPPGGPKMVEEVVYEGGGLYDDEAGPYSGSDSSGRTQISSTDATAQGQTTYDPGAGGDPGGGGGGGSMPPDPGKVASLDGKGNAVLGEDAVEPVEHFDDEA